MATPTILINNSTGSDTAASGAGPSTALTGTAASTNGTGLVVTLDGSPDLTNVLTDGSHVIWVNTAASRQFAAITAKDNTAKTVTTTTAFTASVSGRTWAIGGKRATLDEANTRKIFSADAGSNWFADVQETGTDYTITGSTLILNLGTPFTFFSSSTNRPTIKTSVNSMALVTGGANNTNGHTFRHLRLQHAATTRGVGIYPLSNNMGYLTIQDCVFDGFSIALDGSYSVGYAFPVLTLLDSEFLNGTGASVVKNGNSNLVVTENCFFHDNAGVVLDAITSIETTRCIFSRNLAAIYTIVFGNLWVRNSIFHGSTSVSQAAILVSIIEGILTGNIFYGNKTGADVTMGALTPNTLFNHNNAYGNNVTADRSHFSAGTGDVTLTADPFTNAASNDFTLNSESGGGTLLKGVGSPSLAPGLTGTSYGDIGPIQSAGSSGTSNNVIVHRRRKVL